jgi:outer membrane receptor for ferrienterochelin and colicins
MKRLILPFLLLMSVLVVHAQEKVGVISGKVNTADGLPATNVMVFLKGLNRIVYTMENGAFRISSPSGSQVLVVQSNTKKQIEIPVTVIAGKEQEIPFVQLREKSYELNEVVITGLYEPQSIRNSVYNIRTISSQMIKLRGATDLKNILSTELGIRFSTDPMTGISNPKFMGLNSSSSGIKILLDGVPMMDRGVDKESLGQIDINTVERIEIVEGPMSVIYGTDAMAGVINIITKRGNSDQLSVTARVQEETAGKEYDAFDNKGIHNEYLSVNWQKNGWHVGASGTRNNFGGWKGNKTGRAQEWLPKDQWLTAATTGYKNSKMDLWYRFNGTDETLSLRGDYDPTLAAPVAADKQYLSKRWFHQLQGSFFLGDKLSLDMAGSYTDYSRRTLSTNKEINTGKETLSLEPGSQDKDVMKSTFFRSTLQYRLSPLVTLQPGIEFNRSTGKGDRIAGEPAINDYAFFLSSQLQLTDAIQVKPGFRMVKNSVYDAPPFIPSLHTKIRLNEDLDFRLSYARGFRAPVLRELYFYFRDANHDIAGNLNLKAEHSNSFNTSLSWTLKNSPELRLNTIWSGFFNDYKNRIVLGTVEGNDRLNTYLNFDKSRTLGGEWTGVLSWNNLQANLGLSYIGQYNELSDQKEISGSNPKYVWSPEVSTNISYLIPKLETSVSFFYKFTGKQSAYTSSTVDGKQVARLSEMSAFHMSDMSLNKIVNKYLTINGGVRNLFNVTRIRTVGIESGAHVGDGNNPFGFGRSYFLGLTMHWSKK